MDTRQLLTDIACGDEAAFKSLFEIYQEKIYLYLLRVTKSQEISEEILLDIFLKLWLGREMLPEIINLDAFLQKVAYNKAMDFFRIAARNKNLQKLIAREMESVREREADHKLLDKEYNSILNDVLRKLSPQRRLIFSLSRIEGLTHDQIAQQLQLSPNTVKNTIGDTLKIIRQYLQQNNLHVFFILIFGFSDN